MAIPCPKNGHKARLRIGGGARPWFPIKTQIGPVANAREIRMQAVAAACVRVRMDRADIVEILTTLGQQESEAAFSKIEKRGLLEASGASDAAPADAAPQRLATTVRELGNLWVSGELARKFPHKVRPVDDETAKKARTRLAVLYKSIGNVALENFTEEDADAAIGALPEMQSTTRGQYQALLRRVLNLAVSLKLIKASPIPRGWCGPVKGTRANCFLYPPDDLQLLRCGAVEFAYRLLWGFIAREGCRLDEALELQWTHLDLQLGTLRLDENKTRRPRTWHMEPGTTRALVWWRAELERQGQAPTGCVFGTLSDLNERTAAAALREHVTTCGLHERRPELLEENSNRRWIHVHSLRGTFVTLALAANWSEAQIMSKTGHRTSDQLHAYDSGSALARSLGFGAFLTPLDEALGLETAANDRASNVGGAATGKAARADQGNRPGLGGDHPARADLRDTAAGADERLAAAPLGVGPVRNAVQPYPKGLAGDQSEVSAKDSATRPGVAGSRLRGDAFAAARSGRVLESESAATEECSGIDRGDDLNQTVTGVVPGVVQTSRNSIKTAGLWGLPQTPVAQDGQTDPGLSADLHEAARTGLQLGPAPAGGVDQGPPPADVSLAAAIHLATAAGQWGVAEALAGLMRERQRLEMAPGVTDLAARRTKQGGQ